MVFFRTAVSFIASNNRGEINARAWRAKTEGWTEYQTFNWTQKKPGYLNKVNHGKHAEIQNGIMEEFIKINCLEINTTTIIF